MLREGGDVSLENWVNFTIDPQHYERTRAKLEEADISLDDIERIEIHTSERMQ
jgi:hypothetical protein